jgi:hypothetical protein
MGVWAMNDEIGPTATVAIRSGYGVLNAQL